MCGICGIWSDRHTALGSGRMSGMLETIVHRGPDGEGSSSGPASPSGMRRLAIIDLAGGDQPVYNEDGSVAVVFNGEIHNFRELRSELEREGHRFVTRSDTEALVHGYEQWGDGMLGRLVGMFVFALWDERRGRLLIARDRFGKKPLYYSRDEGGLVLGSEIKAPLAAGVSADLDDVGDWPAAAGGSTYHREHGQTGRELRTGRGGRDIVERRKRYAHELGIDDYVTFTGRVPDQEMLEMLNTADVRVNPDVANELNDKSTTNKIMEYMALGKPIVQFDLTEGWFSAQDASLYARQNDVVDIAEKIIEVLDDPARRARMMEFARRRIENELEWRYEAPKTAGSLQGPILQQCGKRPHACNRPLIVFSKPDQLMISVREP